MTTTNRAKGHLSGLLRRLERGKWSLIRYRGRPVSRLFSITERGNQAEEELLARLARTGLIRRALEPPNPRLLDDPVPSLTEEQSLVQALLAERREGR